MDTAEFADKVAMAIRGAWNGKAVATERALPSLYEGMPDPIREIRVRMPSGDMFLVTVQKESGTVVQGTLSEA